MLKSQSQIKESDSNIHETIIELSKSSTRILIIFVIVFYLFWYFVMTDGLNPNVVLRLFPTTSVLAIMSLIALRLLGKQLLGAQIIWLVGLAGSIILTYYALEQPEIAFFLILLPFISVVLMGFTAGVTSITFNLLASLWLMQGHSAVALPPSFVFIITLVGVFVDLLGWGATRSLVTAVDWYKNSHDQANKNLLEAQFHRAEVVQAMNRLDKANHRLERLNNALAIARAESDDAKESRNRFVLAVSHELRTPLNFIIGFSELMVNNPMIYSELSNWPNGLYEDVREIYKSSLHLLSLVNDVLDLGQIEKKQFNLLKDWVNPVQILSDVANMFKHAFEQKGLFLEIQAASNLPNIFIDNTRIRQVLINLMNNSLRVTDTGGVYLELKEEKDHIQFCVQDTGPGVSESDLPNIFREFYQAGNQQFQRRDGTGLGLTISRSFVEIHGGKMWIDSELGIGTRICFNIPIPRRVIEKNELPNLQDEKGDYWESLEEKARKNQLLLVLSTNPVAEEVIKQHLNGVHIQVIQDPLNLVKKINEILPNGILVDQNTISARKIFQMLHECKLEIPVICFPFPSNSGIGGNLPESVKDFLVKPISQNQLYETLLRLGDDVRKILVVDDNPAMIRFISQVVNANTKNDGRVYELLMASTGAEALHLLQKESPDAILLDLALPDISGWQILEEKERIKGIKQIPVVLISAYDRPSLKLPGGQMTMEVWTGRPLTGSELGENLRHFLKTFKPDY